jgi:photoactive yellow protein
MSQSGVDLAAVKQVISGLRERLAQLEQENDKLRDENKVLADLVKAHRERSLGDTVTASFFEGDESLNLRTSGADRRRMSSTPTDESALYYSPRPSSYDRSYERATTDMSARPSSASRGFERDMPTRPHRVSTPMPPQNIPESAYYGRGLIPGSEFDPASASPPPSGAAPGFDLGYINQVPPEQLESLPYGLIVLDTDGNILFYNETESKLAGFERERVLGKNFFGEVAPCARVKAFEGRFHEFVQGKLGRVTFFDFAFHFAHGTQNVLIGLSHGRKKGHINVMMMRR